METPISNPNIPEETRPPPMSVCLIMIIQIHLQKPVQFLSKHKNLPLYIYTPSPGINIDTSVNSPFTGDKLNSLV